MLQFINVTKRYGSLTAVDNVSLTVERGESLALLGPNGAGKTTLVRMLMGFSRPTSGTITVQGKEAGQPLSREPIGYLAENHRVPHFLTGREYLLRQAQLLGVPSQRRKSSVEDALAMSGMREKADKKAGTYSKGMVQRIGLANALLGRPRLLVLDEPVSGLDPIGMREFRLILEKMKEEGVAIFLNSHLLSEVEKTCDTAVILNKGAIVARKSLAELMNEGETLEDVFVKQVQGSDAVSG